MEYFYSSGNQLKFNRMDFDRVVEAAGDFRTSIDAVLFDQDNHPVLIWLESPVMRQCILAGPHVIGAAFLDETCELKMLYATHLGPYPMVDGLCLFGH